MLRWIIFLNYAWDEFDSKLTEINSFENCMMTTCVIVNNHSHFTIRWIYLSCILTIQVRRRFEYVLPNCILENWSIYVCKTFANYWSNKHYHFLGPRILDKVVDYNISSEFFEEVFWISLIADVETIDETYNYLRKRKQNFNIHVS